VFYDQTYRAAEGCHLELAILADLEGGAGLDVIAARGQVALLAQFPAHATGELIKLAGQEILDVDTITLSEERQLQVRSMVSERRRLRGDRRVTRQDCTRLK